MLEGFGDVLWYFAALCRRLDENLQLLTLKVVSDIHPGDLTSSDTTISPLLEIDYGMLKELGVDALLISLGRGTAALLNLEEVASQTRRKRLLRFTRDYFKLLHSFKIPLLRVTASNIAKTHGRFLPSDLNELPDFDSEYPNTEKLPVEMRGEFIDSGNGQCNLIFNGKPIGKTLQDNIQDRDGYRFHDVFHIAYGSILHWSPVIRKLDSGKRKSIAHIDETEDSGRARVIEEGLSAYIFSYAKDRNFFLEQPTLSFDLLKAVQQFVMGYEVARCPLSLWEKAILCGFEVFRSLKENNGGTVCGSRVTRSINYVSPSIDCS